MSTKDKDFRNFKENYFTITALRFKMNCLFKRFRLMLRLPLQHLSLNSHHHFGLPSLHQPAKHFKALLEVLWFTQWSLQTCLYQLSFANSQFHLKAPRQLPLFLKDFFFQMLKQQLILQVQIQLVLYSMPCFKPSRTLDNKKGKVN